MKQRTSLTAICALGTVLLVPHAYAQTASQCPAGINPLELLAGTWTYSTQGFAPTTALQPFTSAGQFQSSIGTNPRVPGAQTGLLAITNSESVNGNIIRRET